MNTIEYERLDTALEILSLLLRGEEVSDKVNEDIYEKYRCSDDVGDLLNRVTEKLELKVYFENKKLFICSQASSRLFGYTNEELKKRIPRINTNDELYLSYFVIMTLITMFYRETLPDSPIAYIKINDLIESVSTRFQNLIKNEDLEIKKDEYGFDFVTISKEWQRLADAREGIDTGKDDKVVFVKNICTFMASEKLIIVDSDRWLIHPTDRFKAIIWNYYENRENRKDLLSLINEVGGI